MLNIIKSDLYRILRGKAIYLAIIFMLVMVTTSIIGMSPGRIGIVVTNNEISEENAENQELQEKLNNTSSLTETRKIMKEYGEFELDKQIVGANINLYYIFIVIIFVVICVDLSDSTVKNTLSSAISRKKYYLSKLITSLLLGTGIVLINNYVIYFLNIIINGAKFASDFIEFTKLTLIQLPILYGIISILVCIAFLCKKKALYNGIAIPLIMGIQLLLMAMIALFRLDATIMTNWEVQYILTNLVENPTNEYIIKIILLGIAYIVGFNLIGYYSFKKTEIR